MTLIQKTREITGDERAALESLHPDRWWNYVDFYTVLNIDEETAAEFLFGSGQLLERGAIEENREMPPGSVRYFRFVEQVVQ